MVWVNRSVVIVCSGQYQDEAGQTQCKQCNLVVANSFSEKVGATDSGECQCMKGFYDNRRNVSDSKECPLNSENTTECNSEADCAATELDGGIKCDKMFEIQHGKQGDRQSGARCIPCHEGMVCDNAGVTIRNVHAKQGYWRTSDVSSMMYVCAMSMHQMQIKRPQSFARGNITNMCGEGRSMCSVHAVVTKVVLLHILV